MKKTVLLTTAITFTALLYGCNDIPNRKLSADNALRLTATHAIGVSEPGTHISFAPKYDLLSYLGMIGITQNGGQLAVSDIEGVRMQVAPNASYTQTLGLYAPEEPSAFLTLNADGELSALIESDDQGNVSPIVTTGASELSSFCHHSGVVEDTFYALGANGRLTKSTIERQGTSAVSLSPAQNSPNSSKRFQLCAVTPNGTALAYDAGKSELWSVDESGVAFGRVYAPAGITQFTAISDQWLAGVTEDGQLVFWDYMDTSSARVFTIERGLSIDGLDSVGGVYATSASYGGVGFNEGIIALPDANSGRIVILSRSYVLGVLYGLEAES